MASQVDRLLDAPAPWSAPEPWLTKTQLAAYLGVSVRWIEYQIRAGMPMLRFGNRAHFKATKVDAWLALREPQNARRGNETRGTAGASAVSSRSPVRRVWRRPLARS
jgi:excisionase family DNA binding protein